MKERVDSIRSLRPIIEIDYDPLTSNEDLIFQNDVLRPLLKFQNPLILNSFIEYCVNSKIKIGQFSDDEKSNFVKTMLSKNQNFKSELLGLVLGLMTMEEHKYFLEHRKELSKRILSMLHERIISQT